MSFDADTAETHERRIVRCRSCNARIVWLIMPSGKKNPVDADTVEADDELFEWGRHVSHFSTCPDAYRERLRVALTEAIDWLKDTDTEGTRVRLVRWRKVLGADETRPGPQGQDRREVGGSESATPQRKSLESSPGLPTPPVSR